VAGEAASSSAAPAGPAPSEPACRESVLSEAVLSEAVLSEAAPAVAGLAARWLLPGPAESTPVAAQAAPAVAAAQLPSPAVARELTDDAAEEALASHNGANAPADNPEDADTLPGRALRPDLARRGGEPAPVGEDAESSDEAAAATSGGSSRGTPGMSQPGSDIAASLRPRDRLSINRSHVRLYRFQHYFPLNIRWLQPTWTRSADQHPLL
jgi:hypothetical protein